MSWPSTCTELPTSRLLCLLAVLVVFMAGDGAWAQTLESALMPGKVIQGHARFEDDCSACHVKFNRAAQNGLCQQCHKAVAVDIKTRHGYHGRIAPAPCSSCHTEHKGRNARIVPPVEAQFDHKLTDFVLRGKHAGVQCASCHKAGARHRDAPAHCLDCHGRDDPHKGSLGNKCENCHQEQGWKQVTFDHGATRLPLRGRHQKVPCAECHASKQYNRAQPECQACHRKDDAHKGSYGAACGKCHNEQAWKPASFDHDQSTHFPLRGRHANVKCESCHRTPTGSARLSHDCVACHRANDPHKDSLGPKCQRCHNERGWKAAAFDHAKDTRFALRGKHRSIQCQSCHAEGIAAKLSGVCVDCHRKDDVHRGSLGDKCDKCHLETRWKETAFDHDRDTRFALKDLHRKAACSQCHKDARYRDNPPRDCYGCHRGDDRHQGQLGTDCGSCHDARGWNDARFDHSTSRFPLLGRHARTPCKECHATRAFKDASTACVACHAKKDVHRERLGIRCEQCHTPERWNTVTFDHNRDTAYKLEGAHARKPCTACHTVPVQGSIKLSSTCAQCHRNDDVHFGSYGTQCEQCHQPYDWRRVDKSVVEKFLSNRRR